MVDSEPLQSNGLYESVLLQRYKFGGRRIRSFDVSLKSRASDQEPQSPNRYIKIAI